MKAGSSNLDVRLDDLEKRYLELQEQQAYFTDNFKNFADNVQERMVELRLVLQEIRDRINA
jgi:hypothetical protein